MPGRVVSEDPYAQAAGRLRRASRAREPASMAEKLTLLRNPRSYRQRPSRIRVIETHFSWLFLTPRLVYKLKKPLRHASMDYRTLAARARGCRAEVRLNRRLAPAIYRSVETLRRDRTGNLRLGGNGRVEDYLVKMRRVPDRALLDRVLRRRRLSSRDLARILRCLVAFYRREKSRPIAAKDYRQRLRTECRDSERVLERQRRPVVSSLVKAVTAAQRRYIRLNARRLDERGAHVLEGHGDLRAEHVCLTSGIAVIDCLEFDRSLRLRDPLHDLATLALECARLRGDALGLAILRGYCQRSGDRVPDDLLYFYLSLSALTRARLAAWHVHDPQFPNPRPWLRRAASYLRDAQRYAVRSLRESLRAAREANAPATRTAATRAAVYRWRSQAAGRSAAH